MKPAPSDVTGAPRWSTPLRGGLVLVAITFLLRANSLPAFFVGDDFEYLIMFDIRNLGEVLRFSFWGEWEPLWYLSWYLDQQLWGINPLGYHLTNTVLLALVVVSLFVFVRRVWPRAPLAAWTAALLFVTHPVHDEAVTYLSARGHPMAAGLAMAALCLYVAFRRRERRGASRIWLLVLAVGLMFLAALAKELAMAASVWIGVTEWLLLKRDRPRPTAFATGLIAGAGFLLATASTLGLRSLLGVEFRFTKLLGPADVLEKVAGNLASYALVGGLPIPYGIVDDPTVEQAGVLGWFVVGLVVVAGAGSLAIAARRASNTSPAPAVFGLGFLIAASGLAPALVIDLALRRRYLFVPSIGIALMAAVLFQWLGRRWRRTAWVLMVALFVAGAGITVQRNELYRRAGQVTRGMVEAARGKPLTQWVGWPSGTEPRIVLVTLPARYGGDSLSGAYVFHHTDLMSALRLFGVEQSRISNALNAYHADDYTARAVFDDELEFTLTVSFDGKRAYTEALRKAPDDQRHTRRAVATVEAEDPAARRITYKVRLEDGFWDDPRNQLWLYSEGAITRLFPPEDVRGD